MSTDVERLSNDVSNLTRIVAEQQIEIVTFRRMIEKANSLIDSGDWASLTLLLKKNRAAKKEAI
jgi:hypothetical protein